MNKLFVISLAMSAALVFSVLSMGNIGVADAKRQSANNECTSDGVVTVQCVNANVKAKLDCIQANVIVGEARNC